MVLLEVFYTFPKILWRQGHLGIFWSVGFLESKAWVVQVPSDISTNPRKKQRTVYWVTLLLEASQPQLGNIGQSYHPAATSSANLDKTQWSWPVFWLRHKASRRTSRHGKEEVVKWKTRKRSERDAPLSSPRPHPATHAFFPTPTRASPWTSSPASSPLASASWYKPELSLYPRRVWGPRNVAFLAEGKDILLFLDCLVPSVDLDSTRIKVMPLGR